MGYLLAGFGAAAMVYVTLSTLNYAFGPWPLWAQIVAGAVIFIMSCVAFTDPNSSKADRQDSK